MKEPGLIDTPDPKDFTPRRRDPKPWWEESVVQTPQSSVQRYADGKGSPASAGFTSDARDAGSSSEPPGGPVMPEVPRKRRKK